MATISTRLTNTGTLLVNGSIDEVSFNNTPVIKNLLWQTQNWTANVQSQANVSVTANSVLAPDGTLTGSTLTTTVSGYNNDGLIQKWNPTGIPTTALPYCLSMYVKQGNCPTVGLNLAFYNGTTYQDGILTLTWSGLTIATTGSNTGTINYGVIDAGSGWYRLWCSITNNYSAVGVIGRVWTRSVYNTNVAGDYNYIWGMQIEQASAPTVYQGKGASTILTPTWATKTAPNTVYATGVFDEVTYNSATPTIKNLLSYSQDFTNSVWTNYQQYANSIVITGNITTAPDGTLTASKLASNNASATYYNFFRYGASGTTANTYHIYSTYFKAAEETHAYITFYSGYNNSWMWNLSTQTLSVNSAPDSNLTITSTPSLTSVGNGWYRAAIPFRYGNTIPASWAYKYGLDGGSRPVGNGFYLWGAQLETGNVATTYQGVTASNTLVAPNFARRETQSGDMYVTNSYDEFTGAPVVDSSLTMWIDFGQTSSYSGSGTTVYDLSPTKTANVTLVGSPTFNSTDGGGAEAFNGTSQYGNGSGTPLGQTAYTKSFWFKLSGYSTNNNVVSGDSQFSYFAGGNKLQNGHSSWASYSAFTSVQTFGLNTWYHACVTFNTATGMALYVNGVLDSTYVSTTTNPTNVAVGGTGRVDIAQYGGSNLLFGTIGQVMIYNRALTADEIAQNFNALRRRYNI